MWQWKKLKWHISIVCNFCNYHHLLTPLREIQGFSGTLLLVQLYNNTLKNIMMCHLKVFRDQSSVKDGSQPRLLPGSNQGNIPRVIWICWKFKCHYHRASTACGPFYIDVELEIKPIDSLNTIHFGVPSMSFRIFQFLKYLETFSRELSHQVMIVTILLCIRKKTCLLYKNCFF